MSEQPVQIFGRPNQTSQFGPSRRVQFGPSVRTTRQGQLTKAITPSSEVCLRPMSTCWKALEVYFQMDQDQDEIPPELRAVYKMTFGVPDLN
jgi:hypothetical protein